jgi:hypothetical protein
MALVPRTLEARGLDATPPMQAKLRRAGDLRAVEILDVILRDEVGHVAIGNRWYRWLCERDGLDPQAHYAALLRAVPRAAAASRPFNLAGDARAGFRGLASPSCCWPLAATAWSRRWAGCVRAARCDSLRRRRWRAGWCWGACRHSGCGAGVGMTGRQDEHQPLPACRPHRPEDRSATPWSPPHSVDGTDFFWVRGIRPSLLDGAR